MCFFFFPIASTRVLVLKCNKKWLQSKERQAELFDEVMVRYRYDFLPNLSQLVLLSVSAAVSVKFEHKVMERLSWLEGVLAVLNPMVT